MDNQSAKKDFKQDSSDKIMTAVQIFRNCKYNFQHKESIHEVKRREKEKEKERNRMKKLEINIDTEKN